MASTLVEQGLWLMLYGMGTVFVFLTLLVVAMGFMSKVIGCFNPVSVMEIQNEAAMSGQPEDVPVSVIATAIHRYRKSKGL